MEPREVMTAALLLLARADGRVTADEANMAWRFAREQGLGPEALVRLAIVPEEQVVEGLQSAPDELVSTFLAAAYEICMADQEMHPEELRLFTRFTSATGGQHAST